MSYYFCQIIYRIYNPYYLPYKLCPIINIYNNPIKRFTICPIVEYLTHANYITGLFKLPSNPKMENVWVRNSSPKMENVWLKYSRPKLEIRSLHNSGP